MGQEKGEVVRGPCRVSLLWATRYGHVMVGHVSRREWAQLLPFLSVVVPEQPFFQSGPADTRSPLSFFVGTVVNRYMTRGMKIGLSPYQVVNDKTNKDQTFVRESVILDVKP